MITEKLLKLPMTVSLEGVEFELKVYKNGREIRLCYAYLMHEKDSKHAYDLDFWGHWENPLLNGACTFLYLVEGIRNDKDLLAAIEETKQFLQSNRLLE